MPLDRADLIHVGSVALERGTDVGVKIRHQIGDSRVISSATFAKLPAPPRPSILAGPSS